MAPNNNFGSFWSRMSAPSEMQPRARHDFGWSFQLHRCTDCGVATRNRGCINCFSRFCKGCFSLHNCLEASTTSAANDKTLEDTSEATEKEIVKPKCATIEEIKQLLDDWEAQCAQERFTDTCNRTSDLLEHATTLHRQHGEVFGDIVQRAQACHYLPQTNRFERSSQMSEAPAQAQDIELQIDKLCHETWQLEKQTKRRHSRTGGGLSHVSDASSTASTYLESTTSQSVLSRSLDSDL